MMNRLKSIFLLIVLGVSALSQESWAQDSLTVGSTKLDLLHQSDERKWSLRVPLWVPGFTGSFAYGGISHMTEGNNFGVADRLTGEIGVSFYLIGDLQFRPGNWLFEIDGFHTTLASNLKFQNIDRFEFPAAIEGTIIRGNAGYLLYKKENSERYFTWRVYPYAGLKWIDLRIHSTGSDLLDVSPAWIEPVLGVKVPVSYRRWYFSGQFDVGGLSINNHWSYWINANAAYRFSKLLALGAGWAFTYFNYDQEFELKNLNLGIQLSGPVLSLQFDF